MKKAISTFLAFVMAFTVFAGVPFRAFAANEPTVTVESITADVGDEIEVDISIANNPGIIALRLNVEFDEALTMTGATNTGLLGTDFITSNTLTSPYTLLWEDALATSNHEGDGVIATLTFTVDSLPEDGFADITVDIDDSYDFDLHTYTFTGVDGGVTVTPPPASYTVTFDANGGTVSPESKSVTFDSTYGTLPTPTYSGYRFDGWYTAAEGGDKVTASTICKLESDQTLYAHWAEIASEDMVAIEVEDTIGVLNGTVTVPVKITNNPGIVGLKMKMSYDSDYLILTSVANGEVFTTDNESTFTKSKTVDVFPYVLQWDSLAEDNITDTGVLVELTFDVVGKPDSGNTLVELDVVSCFDFYMDDVETDVINGTVTVVEECTVAFEANGGDVDTQSKDVIYGDVYGELPVPDRTGYTFDGWFLDEECTDEVTADTTVATTLDHTLYAGWTAKTYTVTFNAGEGTVDPASKDVTYDSTFGELPTPTWEGYGFMGWYTGENGSGNEITEDTAVDMTSDITLNAWWVKKAVFSVSEVDGRVGETVEVEISIDDNQGTTGLDLYLHFDTTCLELTKIVDGGLMGEGNALFGVNYATSPVKLTWNDALSADHTENGVLATVTFTIKQFPAEETTPVRVSVNSFFNSDIVDMPYELVDGAVNKTPRLPGDVNDDGSVDLKDVTILRRFVAEWEGIELK